MDNIKDDFYYVKRILRSIEVSSQYLKDKNYDDILNDGYLCDAIENRFTKLAEDVTHLSKDFKDSVKTIPWTAMVSIRNRVCHDYDVVDDGTLYKTIKINFPQVRKELLKLFPYHSMRLQPKPFQLISEKRKKIEMRLNDEKRKNIKRGDLIIFINTETKEEMMCEVVETKVYKSFFELYAHYPKSVLGYDDGEVANPDDMLKYYSQENIDNYGVMAIEILVY